MNEFFERGLFGCPYVLGHATAVLCTDQQAGSPKKNLGEARKILRRTIKQRFEHWPLC